MNKHLQALVDKWRRASAIWLHGIGDNQNTRLLNDCADDLEAVLAAVQFAQFEEDHLGVTRDDGQLNLCACGNRLLAEGDDYGACLVLLPDSLDRPLHKRISLLLRRANDEAALTVKLRNKLQDVAGPDVASSAL